MKTSDIWLAQLDPTVGSEIQKIRPCVVISPDEMNAHLRTVIVAPMTTGSRAAHFRIPLTLQGKQGLIVLDQVRTLDRARLIKRLGATDETCSGDNGSQALSRNCTPPTSTTRRARPSRCSCR